MDSTDHTSGPEHEPAYTYSRRVPEPPRIIVPPPALNANGIPDLQIAQNLTMNIDSSGFANTEFLKTVTYGDLVTRNIMIEWKYEQRRQAQQILPFLYLGPMSAAKDKEFLQREKITLVLAVRNTMSAQANLLGSKAARELGIDSQSIDVAGNQELIAAYPKGIEIINSHLSSMYKVSQSRPQNLPNGASTSIKSTPGKVLVFCESGNERSATLVTAYIMAMFSTDLLKAIQIVQAQRFAVAFDDSLRNLLLSYEFILQAKRDVLRHQVSYSGEHQVGSNQGIGRGGHQVPAYSRKRALSDGEDGSDGNNMEIDGGDVDGVKSHEDERRVGQAPFRNAASTL